jgi:hypothetical protein
MIFYVAMFLLLIGYIIVSVINKLTKNIEENQMINNNAMQEIKEFH